MRSFSNIAYIALGTAVLVSGLAGCGPSGPASDCGALAASGAWVTPAHAGSREMLGYMTLENTGDRDVVIRGVASEQFNKALFQDKAAAATAGDDENGGAQPLAPFTVAADSQITLRPNEREIALFSPTRAYENGDEIQLVLACGANEAELDVTATVRSGQPANMDLPPTDAETTQTEKALSDGQSPTGVSATDDSKTAG
ncbi:copper chaperone PCu(A)C [Salinisphaera japonica]|uniref:Copper chaperone PCu(A)C n=1 Tax=Salinisphaera japonica YTM-1 TaxID=1209778 RepID=A0A423PH51_9GAMM|nr:copper chaperone PCu(A)C [Salinisphaera japonica]ROO24885.1 hypothetical protein SAJA_13705 [Salinisphaera japonica YTM-1]